MKIFYVLVIFTLSSFASFSQTNVGGIITSDTEWTLSGSPYTLTSTVGIPNGLTLTIHPGVQVNGNLDLLVKGRIIVNGTAAQPVKFNNARLIFKSTDLSLSRLTYVNYSNTGANYSNYCGLWLAEESDYNQDNPKNSNTLTVKNSSFTNNAFIRTKGYRTNTKLRLENCSFTSTQVAGTFEPIEMVGATIVNSTIQSEISHAGIQISGSQISGSRLLAGAFDSFTITDSEISNSIFEPGQDFAAQGLFSLIRANLTNTTVNLPHARFNIEECNIKATSVAQPYLFTMGTGTIKKSLFEGYAGLHAILITGYLNPGFGDIVIEDVTFKNFAKVVDMSNLRSIRINQCNFINSSSYSVNNASSKDVDARYNYWGTNDEAAIPGKIYDSQDNLNCGTVTYSGFFTAPIVHNFLPKPANVFKGVHQNGTLVRWTTAVNPNVIGYKIYRKNADTYTMVADAGNHDAFVVSESFSNDFVITSYDAQADGVNDQVEAHESVFSVISQPFITIDEDQNAAVCNSRNLEINFTDNFGFPGTSYLHLITSLTPDFLKSDTVNSMTAGSANSFSWNLPDLVAERTFYYRIASQALGIFSQSKSVRVLPSLQADFTIESNCSPGAYKIKTTGLPENVTVTWTATDGIISNNNSITPSIVWSTPGERTITLNASLNGCTITLSKQFSVTLVNSFTKPTICSVEFDEATGNNKLSWNYTHPDLSAMKIYREEYRDQYALIATIPGVEKSYLDNTSISSQRAYRYRLAAVNTCGDETDMSEAVKSFHLRLGAGTDGDWNLDWEERTEGGKIEIYRRTNAAWEKIGDLPSNHTYFTDVNPPKGTGFYQTKLVAAGSSCLIASNIVFNGITSTEEEKVNFQVYPNPTANKVTFYHSGAGRYEFIDAKGVSILRGAVNTGENQVSVASLPQGIYLLKIQSDSKLLVTRIFKKEL